MRGRGVYVIAGGACVHGCREACVVAGGCAWLWGAFMVGGCAWLPGGRHGCRGAWVGYNVGSMSGGTHPTRMHSCLWLIQMQC